jgi:hypothetical protein
VRDQQQGPDGLDGPRAGAFVVPSLRPFDGCQLFSAGAAAGRDTPVERIKKNWPSVHFPIVNDDESTGKLNLIYEPGDGRCKKRERHKRGIKREEGRPVGHHNIIITVMMATSFA